MPRVMPKVTNKADIQLLNKEEDMMKEAKPFVQGYVYAQRVECEEPCEGRLSLNLNSYRSSETRASGVYQSRSDCQAIVMTSKWLLV